MVELFKQSHRNLGANFISRGSEEKDLSQVESGTPSASGPGGAVVQETTI